MTTDTEDTDTHRLGPRLRNYAKQYDNCTRRKRIIGDADAPAHMLDAHGLTVPGQQFNPENSREYPTTKHCESDDGTTVTVHLHQDVIEDMDDDFGDFGSIDNDDDDVVWTVVDLLDGTVTLTVVGEWGKRRNVPFSKFAANYKPQTLADGQPKWGY